MLKTPTPSQHVKNEMDHYQPYNYLQIVYHEIGSSIKVRGPVIILTFEIIFGANNNRGCLKFVNLIVNLPLPSGPLGSKADSNQATGYLIFKFSGGRCSLDIFTKTSRR